MLDEELCAISEPVTAHHDLWNETLWSYTAPRESSKEQRQGAIVKKKKARESTQLAPKLTYRAQIHRDTHARMCPHRYTHTRPFPLLQLHNLNARDSLTKTSWAACVIAVYLCMRRNSFIYSHGELMTCVIHTWNKELSTQKSQTISTIQLAYKVTVQLSKKNANMHIKNHSSRRNVKGRRWGKDMIKGKQRGDNELRNIVLTLLKYSNYLLLFFYFNLNPSRG